MNALARKLAAQIAETGPVTVETFMRRCLLDPEHGYYMTGDPLGAAGDFVTAPEISQMFGELIGLWCLAQWRISGSPRPAILEEMGPGRGTLMADALRAIESVGDGPPPFAIRLLDVSLPLRRRQRRALGPRRIAWFGNVDELPEDVPALVVANEFFDALPVRQFVSTGGMWRERMIDVRDGRLVLALGPEPADDALARALPDAPAGRVAELSPARQRLARKLGGRIARNGGAALIVDFTSARTPLCDSLQAVRRHRHADRLDAPGEADLAAAVDFAAIRNEAAAAGAVTAGPVAQGAFLRELGIVERAAALCRPTPARAGEIAGQRDRLVGPDGMGKDFRALAIVPPQAACPDGFSGREP